MLGQPCHPPRAARRTLCRPRAGPGAGQGDGDDRQRVRRSGPYLPKVMAPHDAQHHPDASQHQRVHHGPVGRQAGGQVGRPPRRTPCGRRWPARTGCRPSAGGNGGYRPTACRTASAGAGQDEVRQQASEHRCDAAEQAAGRAGGAGGGAAIGEAVVFRFTVPVVFMVILLPGTSDPNAPARHGRGVIFGAAAWRQADLW